MEIQVFGASHVGRVKKNNEDSFLINEDLGLYIVADGMGGHAAGEVASDIAVQEIRRYVKESEVLIQHFIDTGDGREHILDLLDSAVREAGQKIYNTAALELDKKGMGTTCSLILLTPNRAFIAHVGDSRIYLIRSGEVLQLSEDHSLVNELVKRGRLSLQEAESASQRNVITRAVGIYADVEVDSLDLEVVPGDRFLLCSDGLANYFRSSKEIVELFDQVPPEQQPETFIELANRRGGKDNITVLTLRLPDAPVDERRVKLKTIRRMPLFQHLSHPEQIAIFNLCELKSLEAGELIFKEGEIGEELFLVLEGNVSIKRGETSLATLGPGAHFGEMAIMDKSARYATAQAERSCRLIVVGRKPLFGLMRKEPSLAVKILWAFVAVLSKRLRLTSNALCESQSKHQDLEDLFQL